MYAAALNMNRNKHPSQACERYSFTAANKIDHEAGLKVRFPANKAY